MLQTIETQNYLYFVIFLNSSNSINISIYEFQFYFKSCTQIIADFAESLYYLFIYLHFTIVGDSTKE